MTLGHELKLKAMVDMKNLGCEPRALCYEELRIIDDMSYSGSLAQGARCLK